MKGRNRMNSCSDEQKEIFNGMMLFRAQLKQPVKDEENPYFQKNYVTLEGVMKAIDEGLKGTGLSYMQIVANENGSVGVRTILTHKSGEYFSTGVLSLNPDRKNPQGYGSAITYAKRYQLSALFGISSDKDDDANQATASNVSNGNKRTQQTNMTKRNSNAPKEKLAEFQSLLAQAAKKLNASTKEVQKSALAVAAQDDRYVNASEQGKQEMLLNILKNMLKQKE